MKSLCCEFAAEVIIYLIKMFCYVFFCPGFNAVKKTGKINQRMKLLNHNN